MMQRKIVLPTSDIIYSFSNLYQTWMVRNGFRLEPNGVVVAPNGMSYQTDVKYMFNVIMDDVIHADNPIYSETAGMEGVTDMMFGFLKERRRAVESVEINYFTRCRMLINSDIGLENGVNEDNVNMDALNHFGVPTHESKAYVEESGLFDSFYCEVIDTIYSRLIELASSVLGDIRPYSQFEYSIQDCYTVIEYMGDSRVREWNLQHNLPEWNNS